MPNYIEIHWAVLENNIFKVLLYVIYSIKRHKRVWYCCTGVHAHLNVHCRFVTLFQNKTQSLLKLFTHFFPYIILCKTCDPWGGANFNPRDFILTNFVEVYYAMLHTKYLSSRTYSLWQEDFLSFSFWLPWQPEFCMELNSLKEFWRGPCKEHSCEVWLKLVQ